MNLLRQLWKDFTEFWKSQVFWALLIAVIPFYLQWQKGLFSGSVRQNLREISLPYAGIVLLFLAFNTGRTLYVREWEESRKKRRLKRREEHRAEIVASKPPDLLPNLKFRRVFRDKVFVGHEIGGHAHDAWFSEIGNELTDREIGAANEIRAHVSYLDEKGDVLQKVCPARWDRYQPNSIVNIKQGESRDLILATYDKGGWTSDLFTGVPITKGKKLEVRLIDPSGKDLLDKLLTFELRTDKSGEIFCIKI